MYTMLINRCILGEMAEADFEDTLDAAEESMRKRKASALQLKQRSFTQWDRNKYINGFDTIRQKAHNA